MKCTACNEGELLEKELEDGFSSLECSHCAGHWVHLDDYFKWQEKQTPMTAVVEEINVEVDAIEGEMLNNSTAMFCPESGAIMTKYRITSDVEHQLDWSEKGIWLDKGEWELLKQKGVADKLNQIFSEEWQNRIQKRRHRNTVDARYTQQFGEESYSRLKLVRSWLEEQSEENRMLMLSYLFARDPYNKDK
jgi:Zn-finger nucleic acid-binding protein